VPLKLNAKDSSQHFSIQGFIFAYQDLALIAVILKKTARICCWKIL